jgi:hypothetical protein
VLWTLNSLPQVEISVYRNKFRPGFNDLLQGWFQGSLHNYTDFWSLNLTDIDTIVLTTGDRDIQKLVARHDTLERYPNLKVVAIAHQVTHWNARRFPKDETEDRSHWPITTEGLRKVASLIDEDRMSFLTLSDHVKYGLIDALQALPTPLLKEIPKIETFVPVSCSSTHLHN